MVDYLALARDCVPSFVLGAVTVWFTFEFQEDEDSCLAMLCCLCVGHNMAQ